MTGLSRRLPLLAAFPLGLVVNALCAGTASAHVKWFCAYNVAGQPRGLENVLCPDFEILFGLTLMTLMAGGLLEVTDIGVAMLRAIERATTLIRENIELIFFVLARDSSSSRSGRSAASC